MRKLGNRNFSFAKGSPLGNHVIKFLEETIISKSKEEPFGILAIETLKL